MLLTATSITRRKALPLFVLTAASCVRSTQPRNLPLLSSSTSTQGLSLLDNNTFAQQQRYYAMGSNASTAANFPKGKTEDQWQAQLSPEQVSDAGSAMMAGHF